MELQDEDQMEVDDEKTKLDDLLEEHLQFLNKTSKHYFRYNSCLFWILQKHLGQLIWWTL